MPVIRFAQWLLAAGHPLDPATAFTPENLSAYRAQALADRPRGSQDAVSSCLRQIAAAIAALPAPGTTAQNPAPAPVPADRIEEILTSFVPELIDPSRFARIESLVRVAARATNPSSPARATRAIRNGSYLAAWVENQGRPLRIDVVFHPDTVEEFAAALADSMNTASAATIASSLRSMSRALLSDLAPARRTVHGRPAASNLPYTDAEITYLLSKAGTAHSTKHRRHLTALICLGLGVGPQHSEQDWVRPTDIVRQDDGRVTVTLTRPTTQTTRTITALDPYADRLVDLAQAATDAGDQWLLGGGPARRNRASHMIQRTHWTTGIDTVRLRNTYLLALTKRPMTIEALLEASGVNRLITFDQLLVNQAIARSEAASLDTLRTRRR